MPKEFYTPEELAALRSIRDKGAAVAIFLPDELEGSDAEECEDIMINRGWVFIEDMKDPDYEPEDEEEL